MVVSILDSEIDLRSAKVSLERIFSRFQESGYSVNLVKDVNLSSKHRGFLIKARKQGILTIFLSILPDLKGRLKISVVRLADGSVIERFMHTKIPPTDPEDIVCPHFLELKWAYGCPFNCSYCYLQGTLRLLPTKKRPMIKEQKRVKKHLLAFLKAPLNTPEILNTGELCDSLMYEKTEYSITKNILPLFEDGKLNKTGHKILIVTKSDKIEELLDYSKKEHVIVSFSINTSEVSEKWEKGAASSLSRIKAAKSLFENGFDVRIRIDPIIPYPKNNWIEYYRRLIDEIFSQLCPSRITLGTLRGLSTTIRKTQDKSWLIYLEEPSRWGRRPGRKIRLEAYHTLIEYMSREYEFNNVALCKETVQMWQDLGLDWKLCKCNCVG